MSKPDPIDAAIDEYMALGYDWHSAYFAAQIRRHNEARRAYTENPHTDTGCRGMTMRYLDVCSGISAPTLGWRDLGWQCAGYSEIENFPRAVLAERYGAVPVGWDHRHTPGGNTLPLFGDFTQIEAHHVGPIDLLVGGTPCQDFSIAGLRAGLDGDRGNLSLEYIRLARRTRARWVAWENVPGVFSSNGGDDFRCFISGLAGWHVPMPEGGWQNAGIVAAGPGNGAYGLAWRVFDAQHAGVPQRRRRVFVVGYIGDWRRAAAVLFERHSLSRNTPPRREAGKNVAPTISARTRVGGGLGTDFDLDGGLIASTGETSHCLNAGGMGGQDYETETLVAHSLRAEGFDASEDGTGRETPLVPVSFGHQEDRNFKATEHTTSALTKCQGLSVAQPIAFSAKDHGADAGDISPTLRAGGFTGSHANGGVMPAVAFMSNESMSSGHNVEVSPTLRIGIGSQGQPPAIATEWAVRRLTPVECERLQGVPDGFTAVTYRGKPAADGPRYKALGNSMAVPVLRWIGERVEMVEAIAFPMERAA